LSPKSARHIPTVRFDYCLIAPAKTVQEDVENGRLFIGLLIVFNFINRVIGAAPRKKAFP